MWDCLFLEKHSLHCNIWIILLENFYVHIVQAIRIAVSCSSMKTIKWNWKCIELFIYLNKVGEKNQKRKENITIGFCWVWNNLSWHAPGWSDSKKSETSSQDDRGLLRGCFNLTEADEGSGLIRWTRSLPNVRLNLLENAIFMLFLLGLMIVNKQIYIFWVDIDKFHSSRLLEQKLKSGTSNYSTIKWREIAQYQIVC